MQGAIDVGSHKYCKELRTIGLNASEKLHSGCSNYIQNTTQIFIGLKTFYCFSKEGTLTTSKPPFFDERLHGYVKSEKNNDFNFLLVYSHRHLISQSTLKFAFAPKMSSCYCMIIHTFHYLVDNGNQLCAEITKKITRSFSVFQISKKHV